MNFNEKITFVFYHANLVEMKINIHILLFTLLVSPFCFGQANNKVEAGIDVGSAFKGSAFAPSVLYHEDISLGRLSWLRAGLGIRAWGYYGDQTNLKSQADAGAANELQYRNVSVNGLSFVAGVSIKVWRVDVGVNTDLIGAAIGSKRKAFYPGNTGSAGEVSPYHDKWVPTRPVIFNALPLFLNNYSGQSEVYARLLLSRKIGVKVGYQFGQLAYITKNSGGKQTLLDGNERRFSTRYQMPYVAISFPINQ